MQTTVDISVIRCQLQKNISIYKPASDQSLSCSCLLRRNIMWEWYLVFMKSFRMASYMNKQLSDILVLTYEQSFLWLQYRHYGKGWAQLFFSCFAEHFSDIYDMYNRQNFSLILKFSIATSILYKAEMHMALWLCYWVWVTQRK